MMISTTAIRMPHICRRWKDSKNRCTNTHQNKGIYSSCQLKKGSFTFIFFHQNFLFSLAALVSNWEAPACSASARSSRSDNFWSRSNTLSTFTRIISTTCTQTVTLVYYQNLLHKTACEKETTRYKTQVSENSWFACAHILFVPLIYKPGAAHHFQTEQQGGEGGAVPCTPMQALHNTNNYINYWQPIRSFVWRNGGKVLCGRDWHHSGGMEEDRKHGSRMEQHCLCSSTAL